MPAISRKRRAPSDTPLADSAPAESSRSRPSSSARPSDPSTAPSQPLELAPRPRQTRPKQKAPTAKAAPSSSAPPAPKSNPKTRTKKTAPAKAKKRPPPRTKSSQQSARGLDVADEEEDLIDDDWDDDLELEVFKMMDRVQAESAAPSSSSSGSQSILSRPTPRYGPLKQSQAAPPNTSSVPPSGSVPSSKAPSPSSKENAPKMSPIRSSIGSKPRSSPRRAVERQPWVEKYTPKTVPELAVHSRKVSDVRDWIDRVLSGHTKQRLLVLTGPAGTGKTATMRALSRDMDFEIVEWENPQSVALGPDYGEEGVYSKGMAGMFEEFLSKATSFGSLDVAPIGRSPATTSTRRKVILIEDFPNTLFTPSSEPQKSFRKALRIFLSLAASHPLSPAVPPLVLIISESASSTSQNAYTAHRILSQQLLKHTLTKEIEFRPIAPTLMAKALKQIAQQELRSPPSKAIIDALSTHGDLRSAIMGLEFLSVNNSAIPDPPSLPTTRKRKKAPATNNKQLTPAESTLLKSVTQRESHFGMFHAAGKVVWNKRFGDDEKDPPGIPPPPRPPLQEQPYHPRATRVDPNVFMDEIGTDPNTFIATIHQNFLESCNLLGGLGRLPGANEETVLDTAISCFEALSDADILASKGFSSDPQQGMESAGIRADEIAFHTALRGVMMALPSPVKRSGGGMQKMYFPQSCRVWRGVEECRDVAGWACEKLKRRGLCVGGAEENLLERLPWMGVVGRGRGRGGGAGMDREFERAVRRVTKLSGLEKLGPEEIPEEEEDVSEKRWRDEIDDDDDEERWGAWLGGDREKMELSDDAIEEFSEDEGGCLR